jgi:hypothetical protein
MRVKTARLQDTTAIREASCSTDVVRSAMCYNHSVVNAACMTQTEVQGATCYVVPRYNL